MAKRGVRMTEDEIWSFLTDGHTGVFTTLRADGVPISMPIWYAVLDRRIYVRTRGKKLSRVRRDSRASFLVEGGQRWAELRAVHLTGRAEIVIDEPGLEDAVAAELDRKYRAFRTSFTEMPGATRDVYRQAEQALVRFTPDERILNWDNRKLGL